MNPAEPNQRWSLRTGEVLRRVLRDDPGQEYFVYVPSTGAQDAPLFVSIHGVSRNALEHARRLSTFAETMGAVLVAPQFPPSRYGDYQRLGRTGRGGRADLALDAVTQEVAWLTGASSTQIYLFGYSGGAQFAHRYAMAYPHKVARVVAAAAGWYTFPDPRRRFPYGIRPNRKLAGVRFDPEEFLRVPMVVLVGANDETDRHLRSSARLDAQQGSTRVARARNWVAAMTSAAHDYGLEPRVKLLEVPDLDHSFKGFVKKGRLGERVCEALFGLPSLQTGRGGHESEA